MTIQQNAELSELAQDIQSEIESVEALIAAGGDDLLLLSLLSVQVSAMETVKRCVNLRIDVLIVDSEEEPS